MPDEPYPVIDRPHGYMESLGEITHRVHTGEPKARPTTYKDIEFRSRLEVRFAWHLDGLGEKWAYEPRVYGPKGRGYLPDFQILGAVHPTFIEVKPTIAQAEAAKAKVSVIWETHPDALILIAAAEGCTFFGATRDRPWVRWAERWLTS
jgi:hypothetical protein